MGTSPCFCSEACKEEVWKDLAASRQRLMPSRAHVWVQIVYFSRRPAQKRICGAVCSALSRLQGGTLLHLKAYSASLPRSLLRWGLANSLAENYSQACSISGTLQQPLCIEIEAGSKQPLPRWSACRDMPTLASRVGLLQQHDPSLRFPAEL